MTKAWPAKDPDRVDFYGYTIALDAGDSVVAYDLELLDGDVVIDSDARSGADVTAWLSGGTDGTTSVFRVSWETANGVEDDEVITLAVIANEISVPLPLTGYDKPKPGHLIMRYPTFAAVDPAIIQYWLSDAERYVDDSWLEGDYAAAIMALAAHNLVIAGHGTPAASTSSSSTPVLPAGVTSVKSADFSMSVTPEQANARAEGALTSTIYGTEFKALQKRNRGGARVTLTGTAPYDPYLYPMGET